MGEVWSVCVFIRGKELVQQLQPRAAGKLQGTLAEIGEVTQAHAEGAKKSAGSNSRILSRSAHTAAQQTRAALVVSSPWDQMWHELPLQQHRLVKTDMSRAAVSRAGSQPSIAVDAPDGHTLYLLVASSQSRLA